MKKFCLKEPGSAITHFIALLLALLFGIPLIIKSAEHPNKIHLISIIVYVLSMVLLYTASTTYHSLDISEKVNTHLKKFDHIMISILIAGTYTPICLIGLKGKVGIILLVIIWSFALLGVLIKIFWVNCPKWISSVLYIVMGWTCLISFPSILSSFSTVAFAWLLSGGIIYTIGGVIYSLKLVNFDKKHKNFGTHEIFHLFIMGGSFCFTVVMYLLILSA